MNKAPAHLLLFQYPSRHAPARHIGPGSNALLFDRAFMKAVRACATPRQRAWCHLRVLTVRRVYGVMEPLAIQTVHAVISHSRGCPRRLPQSLWPPAINGRILGTGQEICRFKGASTGRRPPWAWDYTSKEIYHARTSLRMRNCIRRLPNVCGAVQWRIAEPKQGVSTPRIRAPLDYKRGL